MSHVIPVEISVQLGQALAVIDAHLGSTVLAVHLHGSALHGGLQRYSDIDLLVTVDRPIDEPVRKALCVDLLGISAFPGQSKALRALELTVVVYRDILPWRHPARRELQFGEWQRDDILAGLIEPAMADADLAILLTQARQHSVALVGSSAQDVFAPVPPADLFQALDDTLKWWNGPRDWAGDERNVVLALSRVWYSAATGRIAPKDVAADWALARLPAPHRPVLLNARQAYLGEADDGLASHPDEVAAFVRFVKQEAAKWLVESR